MPSDPDYLVISYIKIEGVCWRCLTKTTAVFWSIQTSTPADEVLPRQKPALLQTFGLLYHITSCIHSDTLFLVGPLLFMKIKTEMKILEQLA